MKHFLSLIIALTTVGCGTEQQSNLLENATPIVTVDEGTFKLYDKAGIVPEAFCDVHVLVNLNNTATGGLATFENALAGVCEIAINPNPRTYELIEVDGACGSRIFEGRLLHSAKNTANSIIITDHRNRICKDIVPASIIIEKKYSESNVQTLYSADRIVATLISLEGTLTRMMAIGGESTGYALLLEDGSLVEIELGADLITNFVEDQKVSVAGTYKTIRGIAIPVRQVLVVKTMTAI